MRSVTRWGAASRAVAGWSALAVVGLAVTVVGTFLPWLASGSVERDSYAAAAVIEHVLVPGPAVELALRAWSGVVIATTLGVALIVLALWRTAAVLTAMIGLTVGTVAAVVTVQVPDVAGLIRITPVGPVTATTGSVLALLGGLGLFLAARRAGRHTQNEIQDR
ncbi:hypothetical protein [Saccharomonospora cyanea]|uniref:Uncharacterized protein n=1 Tax=Saccharomonospora cyanea NA-134 TaxID=882082 RepID=H5XJ30_9PSEU|nr:hypothetical protein [Saccharomonospora cyanea]EHR61806.1 hypothetical protein SaccyDRAFT_2963 [Saccharomonospora cyanea NA-134]